MAISSSTALTKVAYVNQAYLDHPATSNLPESNFNGFMVEASSRSALRSREFRV